MKVLAANIDLTAVENFLHTQLSTAWLLGRLGEEKVQLGEEEYDMLAIESTHQLSRAMMRDLLNLLASMVSQSPQTTVEASPPAPDCWLCQVGKSVASHIIATTISGWIIGNKGKMEPLSDEEVASAHSATQHIWEHCIIQISDLLHDAKADADAMRQHPTQSGGTLQ